MKRPEQIHLPDDSATESEMPFLQKLSATPFGWFWLMLPGLVVAIVILLIAMMLGSFGVSEGVVGVLSIAGLLIGVMLSFTLIAKCYLGQSSNSPPR